MMKLNLSAFIVKILKYENKILINGTQSNQCDKL